MKINIQKVMRAIPCFLAVVLVLLVSVAPAYAATFTGEWTFNKNIATPTWTDVSITFTTNGVTYTQMVYESYSEAYEVPLITFKSDTATRPAIYWRNGVTYFTDPAFQYITFTGFQVNQGNEFTNWMYSSAQPGRITPESEAAGQIKDNVDDAAGRLEDANEFWDELPQPTLSGEEFGFLLNERPEYQDFIDTWHVFWNNTILSQMMLILGGLMLTSFLLFAGK